MQDMVQQGETGPLEEAIPDDDLRSGALKRGQEARLVLFCAGKNWRSSK